MAEGYASPADRAGMAIRGLRRAAGLTQRELADRAGLSIGVIRDLEQGRTRRVHPSSAEHLAAVLGVAPGQIVAAAHDLPSHDLYVSVLGPLTVDRSGAPVATGGLQQRAVLGLLAVHPNVSLHRDAIADMLWTDAPPATAVTVIHSYISRLRRILDPRHVARSRDGLIVCDGKSYRLSLSADRLDLLTFRNRAAQARRALAAEDATTALGCYDQALRLWRAESLAEIPLLRQHPAVIELSRERSAVAIEYAMAASAAGRHDQVLEHVRALTAREPLNEQAVACLMIALAGTGQTAAALDAFRDAQRRLADELGVDISPKLREAQLRVLRGQVPGGPPAAGPLTTAERTSVVARQLPAAARFFVGRAAALKVLDEALTRREGAAGVSVISGSAGMGKSALAVHWAHRAAAHFPDGQLFVNLRGFDPMGTPMSPTAALRTLVEMLGVPAEQLPRSADGLAGMYRSLLAGQRILVILDNARDAAQVRPLLPGSPHCLVVVTSRSQLTGLAATDGAATITLSAMSRSEARQLVTCLLGTQRTRIDARAADQVADACGRLPLALCIAAARAATRPGVPLAQVVGDLAAARIKLDGLAVPGDPAADVRAAFSWSYQTLPPSSQRLFRLLGLHPGPDFSAEAAASLAGVAATEAARLLADLTESSLLSTMPGGRFSLHDLIGAYASELADAHESAKGRQAAIRRMLDHYLATALEAASRLEVTRLAAAPPRPAAGVAPEAITTREQALAWHEREYAVLLRLIDLAAAAGFDAHAWQLPTTLRKAFDWRARWDDWDHTHDIAMRAAERAGDPRAAALVYISWVKCDINRKRWRRAEHMLRRAHDQFGEAGDRPGQARVLVHLGVVASSTGRYRQAIDWNRRAHALYTELGDLEGQAGTLSNLGLDQTNLGAFDAAVELLSQARDIFHALGQRGGEAMTVNNLGLAHQGQGNHQLAITCHQSAARSLADLGDLTNQAQALEELADAYRGAGQIAQAIEACEQAATIRADLQHPDAARTQATLAGLRHSQSATTSR